MLIFYTKKETQTKKYKKGFGAHRGYWVYLRGPMLVFYTKKRGPRRKYQKGDRGPQGNIKKKVFWYP